MILIDNRNVLRLKNRDLLNRMTELEKNIELGNVFVEQAKNGVKTLKMLIDGKIQYVHSKYDPEKDAQRFIDKYENETHKHVLFIGTGLGYHIKKFTEAHPESKYSIYEPDEEALLTYLAHAKLDDLPIYNLMSIFTGIDEVRITSELKVLLQSSNGVIKIITLPVYEKIYSEQIESITKQLIESMKTKKSALLTDLSFQKRWTINSIKNFPTVLKTPNILHDIDKSAFQGKPAIIVAAGPSLNEEFENLRYIKENGLAYIFSVGSAINALIEHGIYPDAACTYDPTVRNQIVFKKIVEKEIPEIPLIFGSSVGFETLENYPGPILHMITSQDTIAPKLIGSAEGIQIVLDAPSIAVVTLQLLIKLKCNPIILAGQNLGFQKNERYASGIQYDFVNNSLSDHEIERTLSVKDVYGNNIQTDESFNRMRQQLEMHIKHAKSTAKFVNTTKGGAQIDGTEFIRLEQLIEELLCEKVTEDLWMEKGNNYNLHDVNLELKNLRKASKGFFKMIDECLKELKSINQATNLRKVKELETKFTQFDKEFGKLKTNIFYSGFIEPMVRVQYDRLVVEIQDVRFEKDAIKKGQTIVHSFARFIRECAGHYHFILPYFDELEQRIREVTLDSESR